MRRDRMWMLGWVVVAASVSMPGEALAQTSCSEDGAYSVLDFWVGEWDVLSEGVQQGTNRIEKTLNGCAIFEHWTGSGGFEGKSLFYRIPSEDAWKQVWVTQNGTNTGGVKEKLLIEVGEDGSTLFRGEITRPDGSTYFDQTRLTPLADGTVRQVIEVSSDGDEWRTTFDAIYVRQGD